MSSANSLARPSGVRPRPVRRSCGLIRERWLALTEADVLVACMDYLRVLSTITACTASVRSGATGIPGFHPISATFLPTDGASLWQACRHRAGNSLGHGNTPLGDA